MRRRTSIIQVRACVCMVVDLSVDLVVDLTVDLMEDLTVDLDLVIDLHQQSAQGLLV